jgi:ribosomal protein S12 methylthiotransferase accessory factor
VNSQSPRLRLAPTARIHAVGEETAIVADHARLVLEGNIGAFVANRLAPLLDGTRTESDIIAAFPELGPADLGVWLRRLVDSGLVHEVTTAQRGTAAEFLRMLAVDERAYARLATLRVGIVGLNRTGRRIAELLAEVGVETLVVSDVAAGALSPTGPTTVEAHPAPTSKDELAEWLAGCDIAVHAWGSSHLASAHWTNQWALSTGRRALFCDVSDHEAVVGPLVLPGESACFLCSRMRSVATGSDYELSMADEAWLYANPALDQPDRAGFPPLAAIAAATVVTELLKVELAFGTPTVVDHLWTYDALTLRTQLHPVLQHPQCPACRKKGHPPPPQPTLEELRGAVGPPADLLGSVSLLVDQRTGIVTDLHEVPRDASEPPLPLVVRAQLANHRFVAKDHDPVTVASGKGMTMVAAQTSALGEAIERYGSVVWDDSQLFRAAADQLELPVVTPDDLVTYAGEQYATLRYARWRADLETSWVLARRLTDGAEVWVPALGTFMDYEVAHRSEFFYPVTSNGLAAGPTLAHAVLGGLLELVERDAFLLAWFGRRSGFRIEPATCGDADVVSLARSYARRGVDLRLVLVPTDSQVSVCIAIGVDRTGRSDRPAAVVGLGADLDPVRACRKAALEVGQVRPALRARLRDPAVRTRLAELVADPSAVRELEDHDLLYADPGQLIHLDHWLSAPIGDLPPAKVPESAGAQLALVVEGLAAVGIEACYVNLTPPDLGGLGFSTVRVHAPGLQPIHFGAAEARLGGPRLAQLGTPLNLIPHPLA